MDRNLLREFRAEHSLTQPEAGKLLGISEETVRKYERGERPMPRWFRDALTENNRYLEERIDALQLRKERNPVREWRKGQGLSVEEAANLLGCSRHAIYNYECGRNRVPVTLLAMIQDDPDEKEVRRLRTLLQDVTAALEELIRIKEGRADEV